MSRKGSTKKLSKLIDILICTECQSELESGVQGPDKIIKCKGCGKEYAFINVIYITDKCRSNECKRECLLVCKLGEMEYYPWTKTSKRIRILKCSGCEECVNACPLGAIVAHETPYFLKVPCSSNNSRTNMVNESDTEPRLLRKPENVFMCGHVAATYNYVSLKIEEFNPDIVVDDGCGHNLFAAKYGKERNFYTLDGYIDHHAYRKVDLMGNGEKLPLAGGSVPMIISNFVLEHTKNSKIYLNEIKRVLKSDGILIISTPTQYWHFVNLFSLYGFFEYLVKILKSPIGFIKNPWRHFILKRAHENEHCLDDSKKDVTLLDEVNSWGIDKWRSLYEAEGFEILSEKITGNIFSGHHLRLCGKIYNPKKIGAHVTFVVKAKNEDK